MRYTAISILIINTKLEAKIQIKVQKKKIKDVTLPYKLWTIKTNDVNTKAERIIIEMPTHIKR